ncbi:hypothetical protein [Cupriavidus metallidurans]|uniref:hypothetical protein n=1 Tax=Cupriavidus metallidurans TaxID=119219 RepID=UPI001CCEBF4B|nr:hypothetical protein [Cupriavidus metallidurans]UBM12700.1 hypothetical protein LAI70_28210 [Cupriavidus metallidurans]
MLQPEDWPHMGMPPPPSPDDPSLLTIKMELERKTITEMLRIHEMFTHGHYTRREAILMLTSLWNASAGLVDRNTMDAMASMFNVAGPMPGPAPVVTPMGTGAVVTWLDGASVRVAKAPSIAAVSCVDADGARLTQQALIQKLAGNAPAAHA